MDCKEFAILYGYTDLFPDFSILTSIYLHIPFCAQKCPYCSFYSFFLNPEIKEKMVDQYLDALYREIATVAPYIHDKHVKTIYLGGGTPNVLSPEQLTGIVDYLGQHFDTSEVLELSIELNPYPAQDVYTLIQYFHTHFKKRPRLRFSFGIQTFDNQILQDVGRPVSFPGLVEFMRGLREIKLENMSFNFDFIAFGKFGETRKGEAQLWDPAKIEFFDRFAKSKFADSFSLYTLELFPGSARKSKTPEQPISGTFYGDDDDIFQEFAYLKDIILDAGYSRYETSNFCKPGLSSIHNRVYWNLENYIGFGPSASSFFMSKDFNQQAMFEKVDSDTKALRWTNTTNLTEYIQGNCIDASKTVPMNDEDLLIESFFLKLRTDEGIENREDYKSVFVPHYKEIIKKYTEEGFFWEDDQRLVLTDEGMDVSNTIITELLAHL